MPKIQINGAEIYYETYGTLKPGQVPVLLIHGSTGVGNTTWRTVVRRLERDYFIILPDCRGHGQSSNPNFTYSFKEHAADLAALAKALGYPKVHVVGHSNGGCIALLMLMEQADVTQTCVIQAGNAWVSPDFPVKEPPKFDPAYIERESPAWMRDMIALHSSIHGPDYWKTLVKITVDEIVSEPNYTSEDLAKATRPTLVIEGAKDSVNAPMKHGAFMARHIPGAELWEPEGGGHTVHEDVLTEWLDRVTGFWARRGSDKAEALDRYVRAHYGDRREGPFDLRVGDGALEGTVLTEGMRDEAVRITGLPAGGVKVLVTERTPWALVNRPVDDLRKEPGIFHECTSQARLGEAARILESGPEWTRVRMEHDGYLGWIHTKALHLCAAGDVAAWRKACNAFVTAGLADVRSEDGAVFQKVVFATRVPVVRSENGSSWIRLPDGRQWRLRSEDLRPLEAAPRPDEQGIAETLGLLRRFMGIPYSWGGRTPYGFDCSGLAGTFYDCLGIDIPRDADQQFAKGEIVEGTPRPGDLLFFGEVPDCSLPGPDLSGFVPEPAITHVGISLGGLDFLHANGSNWGIGCNSLDPASPVQDAWHRDNYRGARRFRKRA